MQDSGHLLIQVPDRRINSILGHHPIGRVLAARDHQPDHGPARRRHAPGRVLTSSPIRRPAVAQAGINTNDVVSGEGSASKVFGMAQQIVDVSLTGRRVGPVQLPVGVGRADDPMASPRDDEQQASSPFA